MSSLFLFLFLVLAKRELFAKKAGFFTSWTMFKPYKTYRNYVNGWQFPIFQVFVLIFFPIYLNILLLWRFLRFQNNYIHHKNSFNNTSSQNSFNLSSLYSFKTLTKISMHRKAQSRTKDRKHCKSQSETEKKNAQLLKSAGKVTCSKSLKSAGKDTCAKSRLYYDWLLKLRRRSD